MEHAKLDRKDAVISDFRELVIGSPIPRQVSNDSDDNEEEQHFKFPPIASDNIDIGKLKKLSSQESHNEKSLASSPPCPQIKVEVIKSNRSRSEKQGQGSRKINRHDDEDNYSDNDNKEQCPALSGRLGTNTTLFPVNIDGTHSPIEMKVHGTNFIRYYKSPSLLKSRSENNVYTNVQSLSPDLDTTYSRSSTSNETLFELRDWCGSLSPKSSKRVSQSLRKTSGEEKGEKLTASYNSLLFSPSSSPGPASPVMSPRGHIHREFGGGGGGGGGSATVTGRYGSPNDKDNMHCSVGSGIKPTELKLPSIIKR